jgi:hypothetical protein
LTPTGASRFGPAVFPIRRFKVQKRRQLFIGTHDEALSVAAMSVGNPDRSPVGING